MDVAFELGLDRLEIDDLRTRGKDVDSCFALLERWRDSGASAQGLVGILADAGLKEEAAAAEDVFSAGEFISWPVMHKFKVRVCICSVSDG